MLAFPRNAVYREKQGFFQRASGQIRQSPKPRMLVPTGLIVVIVERF
jgi:hypothetical protein